LICAPSTPSICPREASELTWDQDYEKLRLMVGLELHQQLDTTRKLFCHCPPVVRDDPPHGGFIRQLRPTQSEMGEVDPAALFEFQKNRRFYYEYYNDTTCLVEGDEEPPHDMSDEAIDVCLTMVVFLHAQPVDEIHAMRKIVIDGSNTTGFQRTCIISNGGRIKLGKKEIGIQTICLEEDAARKIDADDIPDTTVYRLDRLGIPLIEIATAPDIRSPEEAQEVALSLGLLLRSTGRVKRGLGTIRQDVNVSIMGGAVIEIKGLQQLDLLSTVVELEAKRQWSLLRIAGELRSRGVKASDISGPPVDVSHVFQNSESKVVLRALESGGSVYALVLPGFAGLLGKEIQPGRRLGTELSDYAKFWGGVGGIFHTDELPKYGITEKEMTALRSNLKTANRDAIIIAAASKESCTDALLAVADRAREAIEGVPAETRAPLQDGTTKYARPRPGAERMYPETDVRPVQITAARLKRIRKNMPETLEARAKRYVRELGLSEELSSQITRSLNLDLFELLVRETKASPTLIAATLENTLVSLQREGTPVDALSDRHFTELFTAVAAGTVSAEALPDVLGHLSKHPEVGVKDTLKAMNLGMLDDKAVKQLVKRLVQERIDYVREQGDRAVGGLMGVAMKELRGRADGKRVRSLLVEEVNRVLHE
jgi:glutamyl-tRNA(Gln) amidotransferase subunit E